MPFESTQLQINPINVVNIPTYLVLKVDIGFLWWPILNIKKKYSSVTVFDNKKLLFNWIEQIPEWGIQTYINVLT